MAEILGSVSAVAGLLELGITACRGIISYYQSYKGYRNDIDMMCSSVESVEGVLRVIQTALPLGKFDREAIAVVEQSVAQCSDSVTALDKRLHKLMGVPCEDGSIKSRLSQAKIRVLYPFKESTIAKLREHCDDMKDNLSLALNALQIDAAVVNQQQLDMIADLSLSTSKTVLDTAATVQKLKLEQNAVAASAIHTWLTPLTQAFQNRHRESLTTKGRQHQGAQQLLESPEFTDWMNSAGTTLWLQGPPGIGKTVNTSYIIEALQEHCLERKVGLAYIYFSYNDTASQTPVNILASVLQQLIMQRPELFAHLESLHAKHSKANTRPSMGDIEPLLLQILPDFDKVYIVVDALDELSEVDEARSLVVGELLRLKFRASLIIMSRPIPDLALMLRDSVRVAVEAHPGDIENYIRVTLNGARSMRKHLAEEPDLEEVIVSRIMNKIKGMFLMARLYLETLIHKPTRRKVKSALDTLPDGLDMVYKEVILRIRLQNPSDHAEMALRVIGWIVCAVRPLRISELQHALATEEGDSDFDKDGIPDRDLILGGCAGVVVIDGQSDTAALVHFTAQEYFEGSGRRLLEDPDRYLSATCLTYLRFNEFSDLAPNLTEQPQILDLVRQYPLLQYASQHWGEHLRTCSDNTATETAIELLEDGSMVDVMVWIKDYTDCSEKGIFFRRRTQVTGLALASSFGLSQVASSLINAGSQVNEPDSNGMTAIHHASRYGHTDTVLVLLQAGADVASKDWWGRSPLHHAAQGSEECRTVRALIEHGADINQVDRRNETPLYCAAATGATEVVRLLLGLGPDVNVRDCLGRTALHAAADAAHLEIVKLLLRHGADSHLKDEFGETPLYRALAHFHEQVAAVLRSSMGKGKGKTG